ncbi:hypothetical protein SLEP1_g13233 [Rubroshorea leprosula]|uniref:Uncharacterized protein n=1 Tax=Rubroshorea leprosula TaxID=152421 RepID=A0AAV5IQP9_9ROSI|nr:hypothetical protein SLEP1_g13233 [Rubroshorea leprosula]
MSCIRDAEMLPLYWFGIPLTWPINSIRLSTLTAISIPFLSPGYFCVVLESLLALRLQASASLYPSPHRAATPPILLRLGSMFRCYNLASTWELGFLTLFGNFAAKGEIVLCKRSGHGTIRNQDGGVLKKKLNILWL